MHHLILYAILLQLSIGLRHVGAFSHRADVLCDAWQVNQRIYDLSVNTLTYIRSMFQQKKRGRHLVCSSNILKKCQISPEVKGRRSMHF